MERTTGLVFAPGFFERNAGIDYIDDIGAGQQVVDKGLGNPAGHGNKGKRVRVGRKAPAGTVEPAAAGRIQSMRSVPVTDSDAASARC